MPQCPECGAGADLTPDGAYAHCASCNNIFQPGKEGSSEKGSGSGSGDKGEASAERKRVESGGGATKKKDWSSGIRVGEWKGGE